MKFNVHYSIGDYEDSMIIEADTIEEVREKTKEQIELRNATYEWSEKL